jgi:hypothetical protein
MNNNLLVIGDIHNKVALADEYIKRFRDTPIIFMGDYFDDFHDDIMDARITAEWLKDSLSKPNRIHLLGNHDLPYLTNGKIYCPGWNPEKNKVVNEILGPEDWAKLKYYHYEKNYYFSHAGLTLKWFGNPLDAKIDPENVEKIVTKAASDLRAGLNGDPIWAADKTRGGDHDIGGLLWCDWRIFPHIEGINQVVGHTPAKRILRSVDEDYDSEHFNVDCFLREVLLISSEGVATVIKQF